MKPSHTLLIMEVLSKARRENLGALHVDELAKHVYPDRRPAEYAASIRCAIVRLRVPLAEAGLDVVCHSSSYALRHMDDDVAVFRSGQGFSPGAPIKDRVQAGMRKRLACSAWLVTKGAELKELQS